MKTRLLAAKILLQVVQYKWSLNRALDDYLPSIESTKDRAFVQALCYGTLRYWFRLDVFYTLLVSKPLKQKDTDIRVLIMLGLYQIFYSRVANHAAVSETVNAAAKFKKPWAKKLINGVLRSALRQEQDWPEKYADNPSVKNNHPAWLVDELQAAWPEYWQNILTANDDRAPMVLRVNLQRMTAQQCVEQLQQAGIEAIIVENKIDDIDPQMYTAIQLTEAIDVHSIPQFVDGSVSVQDSAAQLAAPLLKVEANHRVLDVCAAPGGKTNHIIESEPQLKEMVAVEIDLDRITRINENLLRLNQCATVINGDATDVSQWWDSEPFDRILLDVPCSATGVIRRHPDIKLLRQADDIPALVQLQQKIFSSIWPLLRPGGILLYATCSVLPQENERQIQQFTATNNDACSEPISANWGLATEHGRQILPGENGMDGFYYARLIKRL